MKKNCIGLLYLGIISIVILSSCKPAISIISKKYKVNNPAIGIAFIKMNGLEGSKMFYLKLMDLLKNELGKRGIESEYYIIEQQPENQNLVDSSNIKMLYYKPDVIFYINQTLSKESWVKNETSDNDFSVEVRESNDKSLIWKAFFTTYTFGAFEDAAALSCKRIIKHLEKDGMIKKLDKK
jgi:hypothetical protein